MSILKTILLVFTISLMASCGQKSSSEQTRESVVTEHTNSEKTVPEEQPYVPSTFSIESFSKLPPEIDGCACYFSNNEKEFKAGNYIYADNYEKIGFMSIDGKMMKFDLRELSSNKTQAIKAGINDEYELIIKMEKVGQIDETWQQKGTIAIKNKSEAPVTKAFYGECGC